MGRALHRMHADRPVYLLALQPPGEGQVAAAVVIQNRLHLQHVYIHTYTQPS